MTENTKPQPQYNPERVKVICPLACTLHGWTLGSTYPVTDKTIGARDANGFDIHVNSVRYNRPVYLSNIEYALVDETPADNG